MSIKNEKYWSYLMIRLPIWLETKKINTIGTELFIRGRKLNISLVFNTKFYFNVPKNIKSN